MGGTVEELVTCIVTGQATGAIVLAKCCSARGVCVHPKLGLITRPDVLHTRLTEMPFIPDEPESRFEFTIAGRATRCPNI
jgi:hypothetical protein